MAIDVTRREAILSTGAAAVILSATDKQSVAAQGVVSDPHPALSRTLTRVAFGSCADQDKDQPIWDEVLDARPDLFVFLGDNIYGDTASIPKLKARYAKLAAKPGFKKLRETVPIAAIWDDHDFGEDDSGVEYPFRKESRQVFLDFFDEPPSSPRRTRNGLHASYVFGPEGQRVQLILPDLRTHRTEIFEADLGGRGYKTWAKEKGEAGLPVPGPYRRNDDPKASMLGEDQWAWLDAQFRVPAEVRLFGSSLQVLADFPAWEAWTVFAADHRRLVDTISRTKAKGVVFLSGDTHYGEISKLGAGVPYPLWDITSSGLTEVWPYLPPNDNRVGAAVREENFGLVEIDWNGLDTQLRLQVRGGDGGVRLEQKVNLKVLAAA